MPFTPDFCVETPAHETIGGVCPASFTTEPVDQIAATALSEANYVNDLIAGMNANAEIAGKNALEVIQRLLDYQAAQLPAVIYNAPAWTTPPIHDGAAGDVSTTDAPAAVSGVAWVPPVLNDVADAAGDIEAPTTELPASPLAPSISAPPTAPGGPAAYDPDIAPAPGFTAPVLALGTAPLPELADVITTLPPAIDLDPLSFTIDYTPIDKAIDLLNNIVLPTDGVPGYIQLIPEVFEVIGGMLTGDAIDRDRVMQDGIPARRIVPSLARRGLHIPASAPGYDSWLDGITRIYIADSEQLFSAKYRDTVISSAYVVAAEAEKMLININLGVYDARFAYSMEWATANLLVAKGIVAAYNAQILAFEATIVEYNAQLLELTASAQAVLAQAEAVDTIGRTNKLIGRAFAIEEDAKKSQLKAYTAQVSAEAAKLQALNAQVSAQEAEVAKAKSEMLAYTAIIAEYTAEVQGAKNEYSLYAAEARSVTSQNDMAKAEIRGGVAGTKATAVEAAALASQAGVEAIRKMRISKSQTAMQENTAVSNGEASYDIASVLGAYTSQVALLRAGASEDTIAPKAVADIGDSISRFTKIALSSSATAATMAQSANESLARAYARAYETAGRAGAAVSSGKLSGFRASGAISAVGNLQATKSKASRETYSGSLNYAESDTAIESINA